MLLHKEQNNNKTIGALTVHLIIKTVIKNKKMNPEWWVVGLCKKQLYMIILGEQRFKNKNKDHSQF